MWPVLEIWGSYSGHWDYNLPVMRFRVTREKSTTLLRNLLPLSAGSALMTEAAGSFETLLCVCHIAYSLWSGRFGVRNPGGTRDFLYSTPDQTAVGPTQLPVQCGLVSIPGASVIGIATRYGLYGPGIEYPWGRDFPHPS
jgi:hypothetical protein